MLVFLLTKITYKVDNTFFILNNRLQNSKIKTPQKYEWMILTI